MQEYADLNHVANSIEISPVSAAVLVETVQRGLDTLVARGFPYSVDAAFVGTVAAVSGGVPATTVRVIREAILLAERDDCWNVSHVHANAALLHYVCLLRNGA